MKPRGWALAMTLAAAGCPPAAGGPTPPGDDAPTPGLGESETAAAAGAPTPVVQRCGPGAERVDDYAWLPIGADVVASLDVADTNAMAAIERLAEHVRGSKHGLPIDIAFALGQWTWQVALIRTTLASAGLQPGELVYTRLGTGSSAWVFAIRCDFDEVTATMEATWGVEIRRTATGAIGVAAEPDTKPFAYDVVFLEAERVALTPAGAATEFTAALSARPDPLGGNEPPLGARLQDVEAAPIRVLVRQGARIGSDGNGSATALRATASDLDATVLPAED